MRSCNIMLQNSNAIRGIHINKLATKKINRNLEVKRLPTQEQYEVYRLTFDGNRSYSLYTSSSLTPNGAPHLIT